jgi:hypothetical protein
MSGRRKIDDEVRCVLWRGDSVYQLVGWSFSLLARVEGHD